MQFFKKHSILLNHIAFLRMKYFRLLFVALQNIISPYESEREAPSGRFDRLRKLARQKQRANRGEKRKRRK